MASETPRPPADTSWVTTELIRETPRPPAPPARPRYRVNRPVVAGYVLWLVLLVWFVSPASPTWPTSYVGLVVGLVAAFLVSDGPRRQR